MLPDENVLKVVIDMYVKHLEKTNAQGRTSLDILSRIVKALPDTLEVILRNRLKSFPDGSYKLGVINKTISDPVAAELLGKDLELGVAEVVHGRELAYEYDLRLEID